mmetsp:Transcript_27008/g.48734  ORF Transcript_27008/g.48734 Transcript_27008/m.48734 type:complete len:126 (+) Transcript_27008:46-423(+)
MPPKKANKAKPKRIPHPNETPLKHKAPGHGAVERAKNQMWTPEPSSGSASQHQQTSSGSNVARPKYKATSSISTSMGIGIGRGGGGGGVVKTKKSAPPAAVIAGVATTTHGRANPDSDFFGKPPL